MQKYDHAFGKNDIRGIYQGDITEELFYNIGIGYTKWLINNNNKDVNDLRISVCMDARLHSPSLKLALINGLKDCGVGYIEDLGLAPTPIGYYSEIAHNLDGAMIITASHNPSEYNGLKMTYNRQTLNEKQIKEVKELTYSNWTSMPKSLENYNFNTEILSEYIAEMKEKFGEIGKGIKVVVDSANATGGVVGPQLYKELGCEVIELFSEPDGRFPNHHPNPSVLSTLETLSKTVVEYKADLGIAFDGDSDRVLAVDENGNIIGGCLAEVYCWNIMFIDILWFDEAYRKQGLGSQMLQEMERIAGEKNCTLIHLDTYDFQAKDFYLKHGFEVFGVLEDCPPGHCRYFLKKSLK